MARDCIHPVVQHDERDRPYCGQCGEMLTRFKSATSVTETY